MIDLSICYNLHTVIFAITHLLKFRYDIYHYQQSCDCLTFVSNSGRVQEMLQSKFYQQQQQQKKWKRNERNKLNCHFKKEVNEENFKFHW